MDSTFREDQWSVETMSQKQKVRGSTLVEQGEHEGMTYGIIKVSGMRVYHNGYVRIADSAESIDQLYSEFFNSEVEVTYDRIISDVKTVELTYSGTRVKELPEGYWIGFDTAHIWNDQNPETKTHRAVREKTFKLIEELKDKELVKELKKDE